MLVVRGRGGGSQGSGGGRDGWMDGRSVPCLVAWLVDSRDWAAYLWILG